MRTLAPLAALALIAGCTTPAYVSPVEVTRFTAPQVQLGRGPIAVRAAPGEDPQSWQYAAYERAVAEELRQLGYTVTGDDAAQLAEVSVERFVAQNGGGRSPVNVGVGGSTGSYGSGMGVGVGIDLSGPPPEVTANHLGVTIRDNGTGQALWEGRAEFSASRNSQYAGAQAAAQKMAAALFAGFPGESGETIEVK